MVTFQSATKRSRCTNEDPAQNPNPSHKQLHNKSVCVYVKTV